MTEYSLLSDRLWKTAKVVKDDKEQAEAISQSNSDRKWK